MVDRDVATRNLRNGQITIQDNGGSNSLVVPIEEGNLSWTETRAAAVVHNRGVISHRASTTEEPITLSFTIKYVAIEGRTTSAADPTVHDALTKTGNASAWVSVEDCGPYAVDLVFDVTSPCLASASDEDEQITFPGFHADSFQFDEGDEYNTLAISGTALATAPTVTRS